MLAAVLAALLGFALLALSQDRHYERVFESDRPDDRVPYLQRVIGFTSICSALPLCIATEGAGFGSLLWVVLMGAAAMAVAQALSWRPRWLRWMRRVMWRRRLHNQRAKPTTRNGISLQRKSRT